MNDLAPVIRRLENIEALLRQLLHPAESLDTARKAEALMQAIRSGDKRAKRDVLKKINGES